MVGSPIKDSKDGTGIVQIGTEDGMLMEWAQVGVQWWVWY